MILLQPLWWKSFVPMTNTFCIQQRSDMVTLEIILFKKICNPPPFFFLPGQSHIILVYFLFCAQIVTDIASRSSFKLSSLSF